MDAISKLKLENRIKELKDWLDKNGNNCQEEQLHTEPEITPEKIYWHYGYLVALNDMLNLMQKKSFELN